MIKYKGIVKWNGNHYYSGEEVIGSKIKVESDYATLENGEWKFENGRVFLYNDEPIDDFPYFGEARNQWVEVESFEQMKD